MNNPTPAQPNSSETPETLKAAAAQMLQGWFIGHTSGENCMNTLVDIFTEMREETEDAESIGKVVDAFLGPSLRQLETERNALRTELGEANTLIDGLKESSGDHYAYYDDLKATLVAGGAWTEGDSHAKAITRLIAQLQQSRAEVATLNGKLAAAENLASGDAKERARQRALPLIYEGSDYVRPDVRSTTLIQALYSHEWAETQDLRAQLTAAQEHLKNSCEASGINPLQPDKLAYTVSCLQAKLAAAEKERDEYREGVGELGQKLVAEKEKLAAAEANTLAVRKAAGVTLFWAEADRAAAQKDAARLSDELAKANQQIEGYRATIQRGML